MKVVFLGCVSPDGIAEELQTKCRSYDVPGNVLQKALIAGFDAFTDLQIITSPNVKGLPSGHLTSFEFSHNESAEDYCVGFTEKVGFREWNTANGILNCLDRCGYVDIIFIYSIITPLLFAAQRYKRTHPSVKIIEMITDLPQYMSSNSSICYRIAKRIKTTVDYHLMNCVDGYALLSLVMAEEIPTRNKPIVQIEGIYDNNFTINQGGHKKKTILYSGNLGRRYGIVDLLEAFTRTSIDYKLHICGVGDGAEDVKRYAEKDNRIVFLGSLPRNEVLRLQGEATLLINPRHRTDAFTRYSFPSKTMEYMASGTPTLMSPLDCLPEDYKEHLYLFDNESVEGMARKIEEICSKPQEELDAFGKAASEFILKNKTPEAQVRKMLDALL